jgi:hypothetical protein
VATIGMNRFMSKASFDAYTGKTVIGEGSVRRMFRRQLATIRARSAEIHGGIPTVIGEMGLCYDLDKGAAYELSRTNPDKAWKTHVKALSAYYDAVDANLLHALQWNYTADNTNSRGDQWNDEDFSIFSRDQQEDTGNVNSGGRALAAVVRPYARATAGEPQWMSFDVRKKVFEFEFRHDPQVTVPSEFFIPSYQYPDGDYATRQRIIEEHTTYQQGMMWFLANDSRVPEPVRQRVSRWGLAKDEFADNMYFEEEDFKVLDALLGLGAELLQLPELDGLARADLGAGAAKSAAGIGKGKIRCCTDVVSRPFLFVKENSHSAKLLACPHTAAAYNTSAGVSYKERILLVKRKWLGPPFNPQISTSEVLFDGLKLTIEILVACPAIRRMSGKHQFHSKPPHTVYLLCFGLDHHSACNWC